MSEEFDIIKMAGDQVEELAEALRPFAAFGEEAPWPGTAWEHCGDEREVIHYYKNGKIITVGDFKRAAAVLAKAYKGGGKQVTDDLKSRLRLWHGATGLEAVARIEDLEEHLADADATAFKLNSGEELQSLMRTNNELLAQLVEYQGMCIRREEYIASKDLWKDFSAFLAGEAQ